MKKSSQRRWRSVPKEELDAEVSRRGKPKPIDERAANAAKESRKRESRRLAVKK